MFKSNNPYVHFKSNSQNNTIHWVWIWRSRSVSCSVMSNSATPWTVAHQAPLSMEFSRQEDWSGLPFPSPGDLPNPGIKPRSPTLQADSLLSEPAGKPTGYGEIDEYIDTK